MKKILFGFILGAIAFAGLGYAITVNPASAVTADSAATPLTIPYRDSAGAFDAGSLSNSLQAAPIDTWNRTKAQFDAITPVRKGQVYFCTDCAEAMLCVSTGTSLSMFQRVDSPTEGCGSGD
jgi:hypothetical protein